MRRTWVIIMSVDNEEIRISSVPAGTKPVANPTYRCHGPFASKAAALRALSQKSSAVRRTLYEGGKQFVD